MTKDIDSKYSKEIEGGIHLTLYRAGQTNNRTLFGLEASIEETGSFFFPIGFKSEAHAKQIYDRINSTTDFDREWERVKRYLEGN